MKKIDEMSVVAQLYSDRGRRKGKECLLKKVFSVCVCGSVAARMVRTASVYTPTTQTFPACTPSLGPGLVG